MLNIYVVTEKHTKSQKQNLRSMNQENKVMVK